MEVLHEAHDPLAPAMDSLRLQLCMNAWTPIDVAILLKGSSNPFS
jgi:hypothetical protein